MQGAVNELEVYFSEGRRGQRGDSIGGRLLEEDMATLPEQLKDVSIKGNAC